MQESENKCYQLPENIVAKIPNCLTKEQCRKLIKYHQANFNLVTHDDAAEQYNGRRIPFVNIRNLEIKRIIAEYQYKAISEIWKVYGERAYPEQSELMWWPAGKGQDMHIDVMAKPLYEIPIETRKGTQLEFIEDEDEVINVVPYTDYASILYLNDNFEGGETYFEDGQECKPETGTCVIFQSMKHFHGVRPANVDGTGEDRYTAPIWYTTQAEEMELQSHGTQGTNKDGGWRDLIRNPDPETVNVGVNSEPVREWWAKEFNIKTIDS